MRSLGRYPQSNPTTTTKRKASTVNSHDTNSSDQSGASISLMKKMLGIFRPRRGAVLRRIYAGSNSDSVSPSERTRQIQEMYTRPGISALLLSLGGTMTSTALEKEQKQSAKDFLISMQNIETINNNMKETMTNAIATEVDILKPREYYFYAYQYRLNGQWFSTMLYDTPEQAAENTTDKAIVRRKLCCVVL
jgi:hypothetical protein